MKRIFVPLTKVDAEQRLVFGIAALEQLDKSGEIFDYAGSKPHFQKWSADFEKLSLPAVQVFGDNAKSYGNVREMHGKIAAGKIASPIGFDDVNKTIEVCAKVTDDAAWLKVQEGVYTGFSIGGEYEKIWDDPTVKFRDRAAKRYIAVPSETSLVDNPCMPGAEFQYIKASGTNPELRKFITVEFSAQDIPVALYKICEALGTDGGTVGSVHERALRVMKRAKELNVDASGFAKAYITQFGGSLDILGKTALAKGIWDISEVASVLMNLNYCRLCLESEADYEGDGSEIPARLKEVVVTLSSILVDLSAEETAELVAAAKSAADSISKETDNMKKFFELHKATIEKAAGSSTDPELKKMATHLKEIGKHVDGIRKAHGAMGEHLDELDPKEESGDGKGKEVETEAEKLAKAELAKAELAKALPATSLLEKWQSETTAQIKNLTEAFAKFLGATPAAPAASPNPQIVPVTKAADGAAAVPAIDPKDPEAALKVMKRIHTAGPVAVSK